VATLTLLLLAVLLTGCGFQLRGNVALAPGIEPLHIERVGGQLEIELRTLLTSSGVQLSTDLQRANTQLTIRRQKSDRQSTALGEGARVIEYQLRESVSFALRYNSGDTIFSSGKLTERKIMENDPNKMASSNAEEDILRREMVQNLAATIVRQLATIQLPATAATIEEGR
jgi:LPS-assembly lipoprotein